MGQEYNLKLPAPMVAMRSARSCEDPVDRFGRSSRCFRRLPDEKEWPRTEYRRPDFRRIRRHSPAQVVEDRLLVARHPFLRRQETEHHLQ